MKSWNVAVLGLFMVVLLVPTFTPEVTDDALFYHVGSTC